MAKTRARDLAKEAAWRRRLGQQAESGQSVRAWCRKHRVTEAAFYRWRRELVRRDAAREPSGRRGAGKQAASFVPVHVAGEPTRDGYLGGGDQDGGAALIEIVLTDGRRVRISGPVDQQRLTAVLEALALTEAVVAESRSC